jgi:murein DD-endopeptidase MepM/ murein hydrolase activator NlpD
VIASRFKIFLLTLFAHTSLALALPQNDPVPGGLLVLAMPSADISQVTFQGIRVPIVAENQQQYALVGLSLDTTPGKNQLELISASGDKTQYTFEVHAKKYTEQRLVIKDQRKVDPTAEDMIRIRAEQLRMDRARKTWSDTPTHFNFTQPVEGRVSSIFGLRRFFNNQPRKPHAGLDLAANEGTPIQAVESGTVIESGDFFFSGNMIYIDHGQGLISLYAHLHEIKVKTGDKIQRGQVIGSVGQSGRVTGPHLHLGVIINQTLVDPVLFLPPQTDQKDHS